MVFLTSAVPCNRWAEAVESTLLAVRAVSVHPAVPDLRQAMVARAVLAQALLLLVRD